MNPNIEVIASLSQVSSFTASRLVGDFCHGLYYGSFLYLEVIMDYQTIPEAADISLKITIVDLTICRYM